MKLFIKLLGPALVIAFAIGFVDHSQSAANEPWRTVEEMYANWAKGEIDRVIDTLHDDFTGWRYDSAIPTDKDDAALILRRYEALYDVSSYTIHPLAVKLFDGAAVVHLHYETTSVFMQDRRRVEDAGRVTMFFVKEGGRWLVAGDHGGSLLQPPI